MDRDEKGRFIKGHSLGVRFQKGDIPWMKGKHPTAEAQEKQRLAILGSKRSDEVKLKMSLAGMGRIVTEETRLKISLSNTGKHPTEETLIKLRESHLGHHPSEESKLKQSEALKGSKCYLWRGGVTGSCGYILVTKDNGYIMEHRFVMEEYLGRKLTEHEVVHHINFNKKDNRMENLMLFATHSKHMKFHNNISRGKLIDESCLLHNNV